MLGSKSNFCDDIKLKTLDSKLKLKNIRYGGNTFNPFMPSVP